MAFFPVAASAEITKKYKQYLKTIFELKDPVYQKQFQKLLDDDSQFANGPYLDVTDSFKKGSSINELIESGILPKGFEKLNMNLTRPLYLHQEMAVAKAVSGKNMVVSTGTGSGKTESFLIPVLAHIVSERQTGKKESGVRALLIYPMNALANDQIERLRSLLKDYPEITYGSYTGQTRKTYREALAEYRMLNNGSEPNPNELISREQMQDDPPHILVTNYAMLEYLMVRPDDSVFFQNGSSWKYVVLDEAHVYSGSTGIEVSMLLRRLKSTLKGSNLQYILTSATLGDENSNKEVAEFASALCAAPFSAADVIRAYRVETVIQNTKTNLPAEFYRACGDELAKDIPDEKRIAVLLQQYAGVSCSTGELSEWLYDALECDRTFQKIKHFMNIPRKVKEISRHAGWSDSDTERFIITASNAAKGGIQLFDARYHMFLRATESVFVTLGSNKRLFLDRKEYHYEADGRQQKVFEIGTCSFCHAIFITGEIQNDILMQTGKANSDDGSAVFLLENEFADTDEDHLMEYDGLDLEPYEVCPQCGFIRRADAVKKKSCACGQPMIKLWKANKLSKSLKKCPSCEAVSPLGILRMFFTGQEAVTSVIGTALFESLPAYKITIQQTVEEDDSGFGFSDQSVESNEKEAKQFLAFSDSRQAAAFYATYMDKTYRTMLNKRLIVETLSGLRAPMPMEQFVGDLAGEFDEHQSYDSGSYAEKEAWKAILAELIDNNGNTSLYKMGLLQLNLKKQNFPGNGLWKLSPEEVCAICCEILLPMVADAAVSHSQVALTKADLEDITHGGVKSAYTYSDADSRKRQKAFIPTRSGLSNKRIDYISKLARKVGQPDDQQNCIKLLNGIWKILTKPEDSILSQENGAYTVDVGAFTVFGKGQWYRCPKCKKLTAYNVKGICPTYHCDGELEPVDPETLFAGNHYFEMYRTMDMRPLRIVEHSAQLSKEKAYEYQRRFKEKELDVLSCSTTFEMGVDVGSLETVFMRNMPPSPANYAQRAGRAGRSTTSAAFALTFCNKSNHDFSFFRDPVRMIRGKIHPPAFNTNNEKIAIRHVYASAMSFFWKKSPGYFSKAEAMLGNGTQDSALGMLEFAAYLNSHPSDLQAFIKDFLPHELITALGIDTFGWLDAFIGETGPLTRGVNEYTEAVGLLLEERKRLNADLKSDGYIVQRLRTYYSEPIIAFLSRAGVFPRYGFPVDTVEMEIPSNGMRGNMFGIELQRDLAMAISEYAPNSQVVANGNMVTSRYIKKAPNMLWKMYDYRICGTCGGISVSVHVSDEKEKDSAVCECCHSSLTMPQRTFIVPEFGFIAESNIEKPGLVKPKRTYNLETAYVGKADGEIITVKIGAAEVMLKHSKKDEMAVINNTSFFICKSCGYAEADKGTFSPFKNKEHNRASGYNCGNKSLQRYSLGYRFETDVTQIRFVSPRLPASRWDYAYSVLCGLQRGFCSYYGIDERDISGCLHYYDDGIGGSYSIILYDRTPGGSGYVRKLYGAKELTEVIKHTRDIMAGCSCGGDEGDASCYSCLRNYYNQKHHDELKRGYVLNFIDKVLGK